MTQVSDESGFAILQAHNVDRIPTATTVRGIARRVGTTSITSNLALMLAQRGDKVLLLDLSLWNCDLTRSFGHTLTSALVNLAEQFDDSGTLSLDLLESSTRSCRPNLDLLPGAEYWLDSSGLRAENGWNFIQTLLVQAKEKWNIVVADLGSHTHFDDARDNTFLTPCAVHAAMVLASQNIVGVCDSIEYLKLWQEQTSEDSHLQAKTIHVVNQHRPDLPFGFDRYKVGQRMRAQSHFIPALKNGLLTNDAGLFFVERATESQNPSGDERIALRVLEEIVNFESRKEA